VIPHWIGELIYFLLGCAFGWIARGAWERAKMQRQIKLLGAYLAAKKARGEDLTKPVGF
jgi:hypothetical protein